MIPTASASLAVLAATGWRASSHASHVPLAPTGILLLVLAAIGIATVVDALAPIVRGWIFSSARKEKQ